MYGKGDNVQNFEVVLANGSIVNANAELNSDLFQALKGSSGNLGIVTRFDMCKFMLICGPFHPSFTAYAN